MNFVIAPVFAIITVITILIFASVVRGLLGVRISPGRLLVAAVIAFLIAPPLGTLIYGHNAESLDTLRLILLGALNVILAVLAAMVFLVIAEVLVPSNVMPGPLYVVRAFKRWRNRAARYLQITRILFRHGLVAYVSGGRRAELHSNEGRTHLARSVRDALSDGGVTFVKLGQIMASRRDIVPPEFVTELGHLQSQARTISWPVIEKELRDDLGVDDLSTVFASIDETPLAAASIAQVHRGTLRDGSDVVVKIRRPGIESIVERDLDIVSRLAHTIENSTAWGGNIGAVTLAEGFSRALREEMDLRVEARNLAIVAAAERKRTTAGGIYVPEVHLEISSERVLVMERIDGKPLSEAADEIAARGLDAHQLANDLLQSLLRQITIDGTFHADPHPGNVMLLDNGQITLLDWGSVGRIDALLRGAIIQLVMSFEKADPALTMDALLGLVERPQSLNEHQLERALGQYLAYYLTPGAPLDVRMFSDLFRIIADFRLTVPPEVAAVFRAIGTLDGTMRSIDPDYDLVAGAKEFAEAYFATRMRPSQIKTSLTDELIALLPLLRQMPRRLDRISSALEDGRLSVNVRSLAHDGDRRTLQEMLNSVILTFFAAASGVMGTMLLDERSGPAMSETMSVMQFFGYALIVLAFVLAMRVLIVVFRPAMHR